MRIGIEAQRLFRANKHGMDFVALELIKNLPRDKKHEYFVFVNAEDDQIKLQGFPHVTIVNHKTLYPIWEQYWLPKKAAELRLDVLHCTANTFPIISKVPLVLTLHDVIFMESHPLLTKGYTMYQRFGNFYRRVLLKYFNRGIRRVATVSKFERLNINLRTNSRIKPDVIYNGVSDHFNPKEVTPPESELIRKMYKLPWNFFLYLGNTDPKKNTTRTLKAFAEFVQDHPAANLVVGDLSAKYIEKCLPGEENAFARSRIHSIGYVENRHLPVLIKMSQGFLYPSLRESFGLPLLEAMACGVPVITSDSSSMPEIAQDAAIKVNPKCKKSLANAMTSLWSSNVWKSHFKQRAIKRSSEFSWNRMSSEYVHLYESVA